MRKPDADGVRNPEGNGVDAEAGRGWRTEPGRKRRRCGSRTRMAYGTRKETAWTQGPDAVSAREPGTIRCANGKSNACGKPEWMKVGCLFGKRRKSRGIQCGNSLRSGRKARRKWDKGGDLAKRPGRYGVGTSREDPADAAWGPREKTRPMRRGDLARRPGRCGVGTSREGQGEAEGPAGIGRRPGTRIPEKRPAEIEEDTSAIPPILDDAAEIEENSASISPIPFDFGRLSKNRRNNFLYFVRKGRFRQIRRKIFVYSRARKISAVSRAHETAFIPMSTVPRLFPGGRSAGTPTKTNRPGACPDRPSRTSRPGTCPGRPSPFNH